MSVPQVELSKRLDIELIQYYNRYAPAIWGMLVATELPSAQAEQILVNTFIRAWKEKKEQHHRPEAELPWLIGLACRQGLPLEALKGAWGDKLRRMRPINMA